MKITRRQFLQAIAATTATVVIPGLAASDLKTIKTTGITSDQITDLGVNKSYRFNPKGKIIGSVLDEIPKLIPLQYRNQITIKIRGPGDIIWRYNPIDQTKKV